MKAINKRTVASLLLVFAMIGSSAEGASSQATLGDSRDVVVTNFAGHVDVTAAATALDLDIGRVIPLPARIVTGNDGSLGIAQAATQISVAADSEIEIPAEAVDGQLIARLVQRRGNVFYDVAKREAGKLRVETPFLVAVIKGTQFNVSVQPDSTTISLFEGRLEIRTPDDSDIIQLNAGEIAIRGRADTTIRVVGMNDERVAVRQSDRTNGASAAAGLANNIETTVPGTLSLSVETAGTSAATGARAPNVGAHAVTSIASADGALALAATLDANLGETNLGLSTDLGAVLGADSIGANLEAGIDLGRTTADLGADVGVDLGSGSVDVGLDTGIDLGGTTVDLGTDLGVDLGSGSVDVGLDTGIDLGGTTVDLGTDLGVDLGSGSVDVGLDTGIDLGGTTVDLGLDLGDTLEPVIELTPPPTGGGGLGGLLGGIL